MKNILFFFCFSFILLISCKEESITPIPETTSAWEKVSDLPGYFSFYLQTKDNTIYMVCYSNGYKFAVSDDSGKSWKENNLDFLISYNGFLNVEGDIFFIAGYDGLFKSTDKGLSWSEDLFLRNFVGAIYGIPGLTSMHVESEKIYLGNNKTANMPGYVKGIFYSSDNGETWCCPGSAETSWRVVALEKMGSTLFISDRKVYYSNDSLKTWHTANGINTSDDEINRFVKINSRVYGLSYDIIKYSDFNGTSWTNCMNGLPNSYNNPLLLFDTFTYNSEEIFICSSSGNIWKSNQSNIEWKVFDDKLPEFINGNGITLFTLDDNYLYFVNANKLWRKKITE